jgi:hypothetical protein
MAAKFTRLTHKIATQLHLEAESFTIAVLAPGGQSENFWIHHTIKMKAGLQGCGGEIMNICPNSHPFEA